METYGKFYEKNVSFDKPCRDRRLVRARVSSSAGVLPEGAWGVK